MGRPLGALIASLCALSACGGEDTAPRQTLAGPAAPGQAGYVVPPRAIAVAAQQDGSLLVRGIAAPEARVRAVTPAGKAYGATADHDGAFALRLPPSPSPAMISLSAEGARQGVQAEGWLFVPPDAPGRAVVLRPGAPAAPLGSDVGLIAVIDYDSAGGAAVSGSAPPDAEVQITLDGQPAGAGRSDARGVFGLRLGSGAPVTPGAHRVLVSAGGRRLERNLSFAVGPSGYAAVREAEGWRVSWTPAGGGRQTTLVLVGSPPS